MSRGDQILFPATDFESRFNNIQFAPDIAWSGSYTSGFSITGTNTKDSVGTGTNGNDVVLLGGGDDVLEMTGVPNSGNDLIRGGTGNDTIMVSTSGQVTIYGDNGQDNIVVYAGSSGNRPEITIYGGGNADFIQVYGNTQSGIDGTVILDGGDANDILYGQGRTNYYGRAGADQFDIYRSFELNTGFKSVLDYQDGIDKLRLISRNVKFNNLSFRQNGSATQINYQGEILALVFNINVSSITASDFIFLPVASN